METINLKQIMKNSTIEHGWPTLLLVALVAMTAFWANNHVLVSDIMESRNLITAREMVQDGHWMVPTMNGDLRLEKPPLPTWLTALPMLVAPDSLALQRGMAGLAALLMVVYFWRFVGRILRVDPLPATLLLITCYNVILMGRTATWDIYCHAFQMAGIYHLARALMEQRTTWGHFLMAGLWTGLSIMSKGPISPYVLLLPFIFSLIMVDRPAMTPSKWSGVALTLVVALGVGVWWYAYVHLTQAEAWQAVLKKESGAWTNHNTRPWWYYWKFFLETGVWSLLMLTSIFLPLARKKRRSDRSWLLAFCWMLFSLLLLSLIPEKKPRYLLPLLLPASMVMGELINWWNHIDSGSHTYMHYGRHADRWPLSDAFWLRFNAGLLALVVLAVPVVAWLMLFREGMIGVFTFVVLTVVCVAVAVCLLIATLRLNAMLMVWSVVGLFVVAELWGMPLIGSLFNNPQMHSIALTREREELKGLPFYNDSRYPLRIELVNSAQRHIKELDVQNVDSVLSHTPLVLLTHQPLSEVLPAEVLEKLDTLYIDTYDDNQRPPGNKRYSNEFIYRATLLQARQLDNILNP